MHNQSGVHTNPFTFGALALDGAFEPFLSEWIRRADQLAELLTQ